MFFSSLNIAALTSFYTERFGSTDINLNELKVGENENKLHSYFIRASNIRPQAGIVRTLSIV